nr:potassium channel family protein [Bacillus sp. FJAT-27225]
MFYLLLAGTSFCLFMSIKTLFTQNQVRGKLVSFENFLYLGMIYLTVLIGFGMVYLLLGLFVEPVLADPGSTQSGFLQQAEAAVYFSAMTLFSVGHGDVIPLGPGRWIAIIEALIGYTIPAAFVAKAVMEMDS